jgi:hypothetical protein
MAVSLYSQKNMNLLFTQPTIVTPFRSAGKNSERDYSQSEEKSGERKKERKARNVAGP